jgi:hypothetical protein
MVYFKRSAAILLVACTASCASSNSSGGNAMADGFVTVDEHYSGIAPQMAPGRKVSEQDCNQSSSVSDGGNLRCM